MATFLAGSALLAAPSGAAAADTCKGAEEPITAANIAAAERSLLCLVNVHRAANGVGVLTHDPILNAVARGHSQDMLARNFFDHTNPDGQTPQDRASAAGYPGVVGENIAKSNFPDSSPMRYFVLWRESPGHNSNMLDLHGVTTVTAGMGFALQGGTAATQMFGTRAAGGTDTAVDLLIPDECPPAEARQAAAEQELSTAKRKQKKAKKRVKASRKQLRRADTPAETARAKKKLKQAKKKLKRARKQLRRSRGQLEEAAEAAGAACNPTSF